MSTYGYEDDGFGHSVYETSDYPPNIKASQYREEQNVQQSAPNNAPLRGPLKQLKRADMKLKDALRGAKKDISIDTEYMYMLFMILILVVVLSCLVVQVNNLSSKLNMIEILLCNSRHEK